MNTRKKNPAAWDYFLLSSTSLFMWPSTQCELTVKYFNPHALVSSNYWYFARRFIKASGFTFPRLSQR